MTMFVPYFSATAVARLRRRAQPSGKFSANTVPQDLFAKGLRKAIAHAPPRFARKASPRAHANDEDERTLADRQAVVYERDHPVATAPGDLRGDHEHVGFQRHECGQAFQAVCRRGHKDAAPGKESPQFTAAAAPHCCRR